MTPNHHGFGMESIYALDYLAHVTGDVSKSRIGEIREIIE
jgi:hypothetical protein